MGFYDKEKDDISYTSNSSNSEESKNISGSGNLGKDVSEIKKEFSNNMKLMSGAFKQLNNAMNQTKVKLVKLSPSDKSTKESLERESGDINMNDQTLLQMYFNKSEENLTSIRNEFKEREERIQHQMELSEKRTIDRYEKIEKLMIDQGRELNKLISDQNNKINSLKEEVRSQIEADKKYRHTNNIAIIIGTVTTILTILGIVLAAQANITDIISLVLNK